MKHLFFLLVFFSLRALALPAGEVFQYPEERTYTNADVGLRPYRATSIYRTNTFTLTFDDGPDINLTSRVLDILKNHGVKATFFVLTDHVNEQNFHLIKRMLDEGHLVGSHGPDHSRSTEQSELVWKGALRRSLQDLAGWYKKAGHELNNIFYRFPYGDYGKRPDYHHMNALLSLSRELMGANCIQFAFWDVDTADWVPGITPKEISQNIIAHNDGGRATGFEMVMVNGKKTYRKKTYTVTDPPGGGVVLQHDVHAASVEATDHFLKAAKAKGLRMVRLDEVEEFRILRDCSL